MTTERWDESKAKSMLAEWRRSGGSIERFAHERGLSAKRLYSWRKKLEAPKGKLVRAIVRATTPSTLSASSTPIEIVLRTGQRVRVARDFDEQALARVVDTLEGRT